MTDRTVTLLTLALSLLAISHVASAADPSKKPASVLDFQVRDIDGRSVDLNKYRGEVLLIVNTASQCGYTKQYTELESLYEKYRDKGFEVLAFPANEFGHQEPGTDAEIRQFCSSKYKVTFPLFSKIVVKGEGIHPLYQFLTGKDTNPKAPGEIPWNFTKFLVNRKGEVLARFVPADLPDSPKVVKAIETALSDPK
ncbi:MAG: glutathione peroxidase [Isosphaeraceae bacterium]